MLSDRPFLLRGGLALVLFALLVPSFIATWQSLSAAVSEEGYCGNTDSTEAFTYIVQAEAPSVHIGVARAAGSSACSVEAGTYADPRTPEGTPVTVSQGGDIGPEAFVWREGTSTGFMGPLIQGAMAGAGLLAIGSLLVLCLQEDDEEGGYA